VQLRNLAAAAVRHNEALMAVVNSVNRYSPTVYDISIGDNDNRALLTTGTGGDDQLLPLRAQLPAAARQQSGRSVESRFGPPKVYDVVCRWSAMESRLRPCASGCAPRFCGALQPQLTPRR
jgi:hypothetical protein